MTFLPIAFICGLFSTVLLAIDFGHRLGRRWRRRAPESGHSVSSAAESSILGLMGLLIGFIFYAAGSRFENRRYLVAQEANAIGTAYLRLDLLPPDAQPELREDFRKYVRSRLDVYRQIPDIAAVNAALDRSSVLQDKVWKEAMEAVKQSGPAEKSLVLAALNEMIDITTTRTVALMAHTPAAVFGLMAISVFVASTLVGYTASASTPRNWVLLLAYALIVAAAVYTIVDYEFPRVGIVREDTVDDALKQTLEKMN